MLRSGCIFLWHVAIIQNMESSANWSFFFFHFISRGGIKSPWSRRKRKRALSGQHWNRLFSSNGKLRDGGRKFLKKVRSGVSVVVIQALFLHSQPLTDICWNLSYAQFASYYMSCILFHFDGKLNQLYECFHFPGNWTRHPGWSLAISTWSVRWSFYFVYYLIFCRSDLANIVWSGKWILSSRS